jgi:hypothetical protein
MIETKRLRFESEGQKLLAVPRPIALVRLQTTAATIVTAPTDADFLVKHLWVANVTAGAVTYSIRMVASGGSPSAANAIAEGVSLAANTSALLAIGTDLRLVPGAFLSALCGTNDAINIGGWGLEYYGERA